MSEQRLSHPKVRTGEPSLRGRLEVVVVPRRYTPRAASRAARQRGRRPCRGCGERELGGLPDRRPRAARPGSSSCESSAVRSRTRSAWAAWRRRRRAAGARPPRAPSRRTRGAGRRAQARRAESTRAPRPLLLDEEASPAQLSFGVAQQPVDLLLVTPIQRSLRLAVLRSPDETGLGARELGGQACDPLGAPSLLRPGRQCAARKLKAAARLVSPFAVPFGGSNARTRRPAWYAAICASSRSPWRGLPGRIASRLASTWFRPAPGRRAPHPPRCVRRAAASAGQSRSRARSAPPLDLVEPHEPSSSAPSAAEVDQTPRAEVRRTGRERATARVARARRCCACSAPSASSRLVAGSLARAAAAKLSK